ncbi:hypothetical protein F5B21DRAFT_503531 [Xylaria acuta]|nr:hypothetical protein F5B21DRAFT_503531 [Xylaria acuta]
MLALVFDEGEYSKVAHYVIHHKSQLLVMYSDRTTQDSEHDSGDGCGGGKVTIVDIHPQHHRFSNEKALSTRGFAIKTLHKPNRQDFERGRNVLGKFKGDNEHENILTLLATYELTDETPYKFNSIFYRADGNLHRY